MNNAFLNIIIVLQIAAFCSCTNDITEVQKLTDEKPVPISTTKNVEMLYSDSAQLKARITAPLRETFLGQKPYIVFNKGIRVEFYDENQKVESVLTAKYAISYTKEDKMEARNDVEISGNNGEKLNTNHLIWDQKANKIYSNVFSKITSTERVIYGDGFESNQDFTTYKILKPKGIINLKQNP
jgi:LPS export ABC transporter protein LptC